MNRHVRQARAAARSQLWGIGQKHFNYPPLKDSWWHIPVVHKWAPLVTNSYEYRRINGKDVVPVVVDFMFPPGQQMSAKKFNAFKMHLQSRTAAWWDILPLPEYNLVRCFRLSDRTTAHYDIDGRTTTFVREPMVVDSELDPRPKRRLFRKTIRGVLGGWDEEGEFIE